MRQWGLIALMVSVLATVAVPTGACAADPEAPATGVATVPSSGTADPTLTPEAVPTETATVAAASAVAGMMVGPAPRFGIAGLVPPNFPTSSDEDWLAFFRTVPTLGGVVGNYSRIADLAQNQEVGIAAGLEVLPVTGFHEDADDGLAVNVDFANAEERGAFLEELLAFVSTSRPPYLGVGNEVNRVWEDDPEAFDAWVAALPEIVAAVHQASPGTLVFATFQYEFLVGRDDITGGGRSEDWTPFEAAEPHLDLVAFTSYPYFGAEHPADLPADYYAPIADHTDGLVGFTELGWPSAPIGPLVGSPVEGLGGTPEEQATFVDRLAELLAPIDFAFAMWVWAYDTPAVDPTFASLGLSTPSGEPKPAFDRWQVFVDASSGDR